MRLSPREHLPMGLAELDRSWSARIGAWAGRPAASSLATGLSLAGSFVLLSAAFLIRDLVWRLRLDATPAPAALRVVVYFLAVGAVVLAAKQRWRRARPGEQGADRGSLDRYSFPSGHAARAGVLAVLMPGPAAFAFAAAVMWGRVALRRHYVSDVLAGLLLGLASAYLLNQFWR